jgi:hypothetical protein
MEHTSFVQGTPLSPNHHSSPAHFGGITANHMVLGPQKIFPPLHYINVDLSKFVPFSWTEYVDWAMVSQETLLCQQLIKHSAEIKVKSDALFYTPQQSIAMILGGGGTISDVCLAYTIVTIINNMTLPSLLKSQETHAWLGVLCQPKTLSAFRKLPFHVFDALRERVFAIALATGDVAGIQAMLALNFNVHEKVMIFPTPASGHLDITTHPIEISIRGANMKIAKMIIAHACQNATQYQLDELLAQICNSAHDSRHDDRAMRGAEVVELLGLVLAAERLHLGLVFLQFATTLTRPLNLLTTKALPSKTGYFLGSLKPTPKYGWMLSGTTCKKDFFDICSKTIKVTSRRTIVESSSHCSA